VVQGFIRVSGLRFGVKGESLGMRVWGVEFRVKGVGFEVWS
jgi:hypothetical protein